jgi:hypothetical protein
VLALARLILHNIGVLWIFCFGFETFGDHQRETCGERLVEFRWCFSFESSWFETNGMKASRIPASVFDLKTFDGLDTPLLHIAFTV